MTIWALWMEQIELHSDNLWTEEAFTINAAFSLTEGQVISNANYYFNIWFDKSNSVRSELKFCPIHSNSQRDEEHCKDTIFASVKGYMYFSVISTMIRIGSNNSKWLLKNKEDILNQIYQLGGSN